MMLDLTPFLCVVGVIGCLLLMALFSASEAALAATNRVRLRQLLRAQTPADEEGAANVPAGELTREAQRFIATVTIAANVPLVIAAVLTVWLVRDRYDVTAEGAIVCALVALFSIPLFQIAPRLRIGQARARERLWWVRPARLIVQVLRPPVSLLLWLALLLLRPLGLAGVPARADDEESEGGLENAEEIRDLVESAQASGVIEPSGKDLIDSIFTFGDTRAHEVMIPRPDIIALPLGSTTEQVLDVLQESGFSRIPIYEGNIDQIVGILHAKDVLDALSRNEWNFADDLLARLRPPVFLPESQKIDEALAAMRAQRSHLAIVIDEFGGVAGLLTVEDILEELVGEIADEHDQKAEEPLMVLDDHTALADARLHIDDLRDDWGVALPSGEFDTVGGFVIEELGRPPVVGDCVETREALLVVHTMRGRRPQKILVTRKELSQE